MDKEVQAKDCEEVEMGGRADLLLVDNDGRIVELLALFLEREGYSVRTAASFAEARVALAERCPDLMLSDLDLGVESGRTELPKLAAEGLLPPTLVVSGYLDASLQEELLALPKILSTLAKPFDFPQLKGRVEQLLEDLEGQLTDPAPHPEPGAPLPSEPTEERSPLLDDSWVEVVPMEPGALRDDGTGEVPLAPPHAPAGRGENPARREGLS
jgi:DNA-binding response OmpR family regulator